MTRKEVSTSQNDSVSVDSGLNEIDRESVHHNTRVRKLSRGIALQKSY